MTGLRGTPRAHVACRSPTLTHNARARATTPRSRPCPRRSIPETKEITDPVKRTQYTVFHIHCNGVFHCAVRYSQFFNFNLEAQKTFKAPLCTSPARPLACPPARLPSDATRALDLHRSPSPSTSQASQAHRKPAPGPITLPAPVIDGSPVTHAHAVFPGVCGAGARRRLLIHQRTPKMGWGSTTTMPTREGFSMCVEGNIPAGW